MDFSRRQILVGGAASGLVLPKVPALARPSCPAVRPPQIAQQWGYTKLAFNFDKSMGLGCVDLGKTGNPGYLWYLKNKWPNAASGFGNWGDLVTGADTDPASIRLDPKGLTMLTCPPGNHTGQCLHTACYSPSGPGYVGTVFSPGFYVEYGISWDYSFVTPTTPSWPAVWTPDIGPFTGVRTHFAELDCFEANYFASGPHNIALARTLHDTNFLNSFPTYDYTNTNTSNSFLDPSYYKDNVVQQGFLWVPTALNGGTGLMQYFIMGQHQAFNDVAYTSTGPLSPGAKDAAGTPVSINGMMYIAESGQFQLIISCGDNWPMTTGFVRVWQRP